MNNAAENNEVMQLYLLISNDDNQLLSVATSLEEQKAIESEEREAAMEEHKLIISEIEACERGFSNMIATIKRNLLKKSCKITGKDANMLTDQLELIGFRADLVDEQSLCFTDLDSGQVYNIQQLEGAVYRKFYNIHREEVDQMINWKLSDNCRWERITATYQKKTAV